MKAFFHGSYNIQTPGTILLGRKDDYRKDWFDSFYGYVNELRPVECLGHDEAVFMTAEDIVMTGRVGQGVDAIQDIDNCGGGTDFVFRMLPLGPVEAHDMVWLTEACQVWEDNPLAAIPLIKKYWSGELSEEPVIEYLTRQAEILEVHDFEKWDFDGTGRYDTEKTKYLILSHAQLQECAPNEMQSMISAKSACDDDRYIVAFQELNEKGQPVLDGGLIVNRVSGPKHIIGILEDVDVSKTLSKIGQEYLETIGSVKKPGMEMSP